MKINIEQKENFIQDWLYHIFQAPKHVTSHIFICMQPFLPRRLFCVYSHLFFLCVLFSKQMFEKLFNIKKLKSQQRAGKNTCMRNSFWKVNNKWIKIFSWLLFNIIWTYRWRRFFRDINTNFSIKHFFPLNSYIYIRNLYIKGL